ncbi:MAG TPA: hypothetical protein VKS78_16000 [Roseiarcus sp.]|nr:hypothetical protein [Roseiarcus sp.]
MPNARRKLRLAVGEPFRLFDAARGLVEMDETRWRAAANVSRGVIVDFEKASELRRTTWPPSAASSTTPTSRSLISELKRQNILRTDHSFE